MPLAIEPQAFVSVVRPLLESNDTHGLIETLRLRWNCQQIARLLGHADPDAKKVALLCLAMVGDRGCIEAIQSELTDPDATINQMAEHALWSIWFRMGATPAANELVCKGARLLSYRKLGAAIECFDRAIADDRNFAEAYNQRALAKFMQDEFEASIADCRKAVRLMPCHFGAWAGMGHCFLHLCQLDQALRAYERALAINPQMACVQQTVAEIRLQLGLPSGHP
jgi:tetratricopeptide (TPR) repeat protein